MDILHDIEEIDSDIGWSSSDSGGHGEDKEGFEAFLTEIRWLYHARLWDKLIEKSAHYQSPEVLMYRCVANIHLGELQALFQGIQMLNERDSSHKFIQFIATEVPGLIDSSLKKEDGSSVLIINQLGVLLKKSSFKIWLQDLDENVHQLISTSITGKKRKRRDVNDVIISTNQQSEVKVEEVEVENDVHPSGSVFTNLHYRKLCKKKDKTRLSYIDIWNQLKVNEDNSDNIKTLYGFPEHLPKKVLCRLEERTATERLYGGVFSNDGNLYATTSQEENVIIFDTSNIALVAETTREIIDNMEENHNDQTNELMMKLRDNPINRVCDWVDDNMIWTFSDVEIANSNEFIIYSTLNYKVRYLRINNGIPIPESFTKFDLLSIYQKFAILDLELIDDKQFIAGTNDTKILIFDMETETIITHIIDSHFSDVNSISTQQTHSSGFSPFVFLSASDDMLCHIWDVRCYHSTMNPCGALIGHQHGITSCKLGADGFRAITTSKDQTLKYWDLRNCHSYLEFKNEEPVRLSRNQFKHKWKHLQRKPLHSFDYRWMNYPGSPIREIKENRGNDLSLLSFYGHSVLRTLVECSFSPAYQNQRYACSGSADGHVSLYDLETGNTYQLQGSHSELVRNVSWHPTLPYILSSSWDGTIKLWG